VEWDEREQGWMLALGEYRDTRCPNCGRDIRECTAPEADGKYEVPPAARCHATTALSIAQKAFTNPQPEAMLWRVQERR
jgi:tRNA(Ile2) C34 agmatinyltransferase TiaS